LPHSRSLKELIAENRSAANDTVTKAEGLDASQPSFSNVGPAQGGSNVLSFLTQGLAGGGGKGETIKTATAAAQATGAAAEKKALASGASEVESLQAAIDALKKKRR